MPPHTKERIRFVCGCAKDLGGALLSLAVFSGFWVVVLLGVKSCVNG